MIINEEISNLVASKIEELDHLDKANHVSSGKLSASKLFQPTLFQILHFLKVPVVLDIYAKMRMKRGKDVEEKFLSYLPTLDKQKEVFYRNTLGKIDAILDISGYGKLPVEIKSVTREKFKRIEKQGYADAHYCLQSTQNALGLGTEYSIVTVVNSSDYRNLSYLIHINEYKLLVDSIIDQYEIVFREKKIPTFIPRYKWQEDQKYQDYPQFSTLTNDIEILDLLKREYPESYNKWINI